ncbi:hypothetical protein T03_18143 [Trichinella britovi]|uniref:Uncharacterized protein n=1 Tax=Trichinella britovi TaxID=45882 RepID=A0A0V1C7P9_TRIBR|nr:hypothetical protein T03_18143 [Trichinella britovi]
MGNLKSPIPAPEVTLRQQPHTSVVDSVAWPDFVGINVPNGRSTLCFVPDPTMENMRQNSGLVEKFSDEDSKRTGSSSSSKAESVKTELANIIALHKRVKKVMYFA